MPPRRAAQRVPDPAIEWCPVTVLLPSHDGLADHVRATVPDAVVLESPLDPASLAGVTFLCLPYMGGADSRALIAQLPALRVVQRLSSGVDELLDVVPPDVLLCNGRGLHHEES